MRRWEGVHSMLVAVSILLVAVSLAGAANGIEDGPGYCFKDVIVSGAGVPSANGRYCFQYMEDGRPFYDSTCYPEPNIYNYIAFQNASPLGPGWIVRSFYYWPSCSVWYFNPKNSSVPPSTGWVLMHIYPGCGCSGFPAPTLSGGEPCGDDRDEALRIVPAGIVGYLDRGFLDSE